MLSDNETSSSDMEECALCDEEGYDFNFTSCCHERLCENCEDETIFEVCSNDSCIKSDCDEKFCRICFDINSVSNRCKVEGCKYTWCDDCPETHLCVTQQNL
jgi:hypothetical protein